MSPKMLATISCPACGARFQTPIEQILDARVDPSVKNRLLNGAVNVTSCPACRMTAGLNVPFIYHDPANEAALLYLPADTADNEVDRQKAAGKLNRELMDNLPAEERKGYLLQPETFLTLESLIKRVLELENISEEDIERSNRQQELLDQFISAEEAAWPALVEEHTDLLDEAFFGLLEYMFQLVGMSGGNEEIIETFQKVYTYMVEETDIGQRLHRRSDVIRAFSESPNHDTLLEALTNAPDEETVQILVQSALPMMDYAFFQKFVQRIESAETAEEKENLLALRRQILNIREDLAKASQNVARARAMLLEKLLKTEEPLKMARSHRSEIDDAFAFVLRSELTAAHNAGNQARFEALQQVARVINQIQEETMPPEAVLLRRVLMLTSDEHVRQMLETHREVLTPYFFHFLDDLITSSQDVGDADDTARLEAIRDLAKQYLPKRAQRQSQRPQPPEKPEPPSSPEQQTPSGLIIAKH